MSKAQKLYKMGVERNYKHNIVQQQQQQQQQKNPTMLFLINKETKTSKKERQMFCFVNHRRHISQDFTTKTNLGEILKWFGCSPVCV
jgi:hypothetical protein